MKNSFIWKLKRNDKNTEVNIIMVASYYIKLIKKYIIYSYYFIKYKYLKVFFFKDIFMHNFIYLIFSFRVLFRVF
jgi:hypothetical protein